MREYWINWTMRSGEGHSNALSSNFPTREAMLAVWHNDSLWPSNHIPVDTFETINGQVI